MDLFFSLSFIRQKINVLIRIFFILEIGQTYFKFHISGAILADGIHVIYVLHSFSPFFEGGGSLCYTSGGNVGVRS